MTPRQDEHRRTVPREGMVSEGGVDAATGSATGALAGAVLGAAAGPLGLIAGAVIGGTLGSLAASEREDGVEPDDWYEEQTARFGDDNPLTGWDRDLPPNRPAGRPDDRP